MRLGVLVINRLILAGALVVTAPLSACANPFNNAGELVDMYSDRDADHLSLRTFVRGMGDGLMAYKVNSERRLYCNPENVPLVDAQYIAIMKGFMKKVPISRSQPPAVVLLFALQDAFPCKDQKAN
jgi:hypothetical protein